MTQIDVSRFGRVAVIYGGTSAEREVSLESGQAVLDALNAAGVDAIGIDLAEGLSVLLEASFDRAFIALHGRGGEDGCLQGALELIGKPYTGSGVMASAIAMDKITTKQIWKAKGLPTPTFMSCPSDAAVETVLKNVGVPAMVKPAREGSSIGMSRVDRAEDLPVALASARDFDGDVLVEAFVSGREFTVAILGERALPVIGLSTPHRFFDYEAKYKAEDTRYRIPSGLDESLEKEIQSLSLAAYQAIGCEGWGRVDLMLDAQNQPWLLEVNTIPGMTSHSLVPMAAKSVGIDFQALVLEILEQSL